jgi:hypothetical protein
VSLEGVEREVLGVAFAMSSHEGHDEEGDQAVEDGGGEGGHEEDLRTTVSQLDGAFSG